MPYAGVPVLRANGGTAFFLAARPDTQFYLRQAAWPLAYETAYLDACARNFPESEFSLYLHGHSMGGRQAHMLLQRIGNVRGLVGMETSSSGSSRRRWTRQEPGVSSSHSTTCP